jgi:hypothetical protein
VSEDAVQAERARIRAAVLELVPAHWATTADLVYRVDVLAAIDRGHP